MKTYVFVDAFNLYYGCLRKTPYRWLNLAELCHVMLPDHDVQRIKYFTALVGPRRGDPGQPARQQLYLRALTTLPLVEIHFGHHLTHVVSMPLANPPVIGPRYARVIKTEEKGSERGSAS